MITDVDLEIASLKMQKAYFEAAWALSGLGQPSGDDPRYAWTALVRDKEAAGLSKVDAIKAAARARPDLYEAQVYTYQEKAEDARHPMTEQWEQAIAMRMKRGLTRYQAILDIARTDRELYAAYNGETR